MSGDDRRSPVRRARQIEYLDMPAGPARELRDTIYRLYLEAHPPPTLDDLAASIADDDTLPGAPKRDLISRIISGREVPPDSQDAVSVAVALARSAGHDPVGVAELVRRLWIGAKMTRPVKVPARLGRPLAECDPLELEVHRAIDVADDGSRTELPLYVHRAHDRQLQAVVTAANAGASRMAVLVGGSSTGKTRACWEAIQHLGEQWWVWHPYDPSRPSAAADALATVGPHTVVWLNEAQYYLLSTEPALGERIAARLRTLLTDPAKAPVLVLGTVWPEYWQTLTTPAQPGGPDPYAQARSLLTGTDISVPTAFTGADLDALHAAARTDARLRHAAEHADAGRIAQHLAGVPELLQRYRNATATAQAVIHVAMDARRLGHPAAIPHDLLERAAPGYLTDHDWDRAGVDWLERALTYTAAPCRGVLGPLTRIKPRPGDPPASDDSQPCYRLADYLEQVGRTERATSYPPAAFWNAAAAAVTDPAVLHQLGAEAARRGRYARAARMYQEAAELGSVSALSDLAQLRRDDGDHTAAEELHRQAIDRGDNTAMYVLALDLYQAGDHAGAEALYRQGVDRGDIGALWALAVTLEYSGDRTGAEAAAIQVADRGITDALTDVAEVRIRAGDHAGAAALYKLAADRGDTDALHTLARMREAAGDNADAEAWHQRAADQGDTDALLYIARLRERSGDRAGAEAAAGRAADAGNTYAFQDLAQLREQTGDHAGAEVLYRQAADRNDWHAMLHLARLRERAGDHAGAEALCQQAADLGSTDALRILTRLREQTGDRAGAEAAAVQAADRGDTAALHDLATLREEAGALAAAESLYRLTTDRGVMAGLLGLAGLRLRAGDHAAAQTLYLQSINSGNSFAKRGLARTLEQIGDRSGAERLRRFGLTDDGQPAASLDLPPAETDGT